MRINSSKIIICLIFGLGIATGCNKKKETKKAGSVTNKDQVAALEGKKFVKEYCSTCHLPPAANELSKKHG